MVYAIYDTTAKKGNPGHGFANTKRALAFSSIDKLADFLGERKVYDYSARRATRREVMTMLESVCGESDRGLWIDEIPSGSGNMVILRKSAY
jgi:hypothetical protein